MDEDGGGDGNGEPAGGDGLAAVATPPGTALRAFDPDRDGDPGALWRLKRAFETDLAAGTGKEARYDAKLTAGYRERYLAWAADCAREEPGCIALALAPDGDGTNPLAAPRGPVGYAFVLPAGLSMIWDAAVLNELYLGPDHRGSGLADALVDAAEAHARAQDLPMDRLVLDVDPDNGRAYRFYEKRGFEPWAEMVAREL